MKKFRSRKWLLTLLILATGTISNYVQLLSPQFASLLMALGVSYNGFQGLIDWQNARKE
ncbi:MAG: hypothetical protein PF444_08500 [Bacteroidales bacterium]|nr:hypothetical protein [Bacteroidales bacterium]